ncbi:hypothetical protein [Halocynthiibacter styelae]|uniref:Uncharacterized protein n=1 Tax=Halocynthiibacter styelae TaxID=2761955 RepID=A0A8J7IWF4_9RHOB|nr:hypothetical protein [Paenihalocynthiibacter styelae]MBI1493075.1 hypothetical protein [Paenihalocynthiibacter styelae]
MIRFSVVVILFMTQNVSAEQYSERFCIQAVHTPFEIESGYGFSISSVVQTAIPKNDLYVLRTGRNDFEVARLVGNEFVTITADFPDLSDSPFVFVTPENDVVGLGGAFGQREFFRQNPETGEFSRTEIAAPENLRFAKKLWWSTPLNAILTTTQSFENSSINTSQRLPSVLKIQNETATRIDGLDEWITTVFDFPELNLTFLGSEVDNQIYLIDANQTIHYVGSLDLGERDFFKNAVFLNNPPRLLIDVHMTAPDTGRYLVHLERSEGVWRPQNEQNFDNVYADYMRLGEGRLAGVDDAEVGELWVLPRRQAADAVPSEHVHDDLFAVTTDMPLSDARLTLREEEFVVVDEAGRIHELDTSLVVTRERRTETQYMYLASRGEVLVGELNGYFLIKDRRMSGVGACD